MFTLHWYAYTFIVFFLAYNWKLQNQKPIISHSNFKNVRTHIWQNKRPSFLFIFPTNVHISRFIREQKMSFGLCKLRGVFILNFNKQNSLKCYTFLRACNILQLRVTQTRNLKKKKLLFILYTNLVSISF